MKFIKVLPGENRQLYIQNPTSLLIQEVAGIFSGRGIWHGGFRLFFKYMPGVIKDLMVLFSRSYLEYPATLKGTLISPNCIVFIPNNGNKIIHIYDYDGVILFQKYFCAKGDKKFSSELQGLTFFDKIWHVPTILSCNYDNKSILMSRVTIESKKEDFRFVVRKLYCDDYVFESKELLDNVRKELKSICIEMNLSFCELIDSKVLNLSFSPVHGDAAFWNVGLKENELAAIDFEDSNMQGVYGYDAVKYAVTFERFVLRTDVLNIQENIRNKHPYICDLGELLLYMAIMEIKRSSTREEGEWYEMLLMNIEV